MMRPGILEGVAVAVLAATGGGALYALLRLFGSAGDALELLTTALGLAYLLYLLGRAPGRIGRPSLLLLWSLVSGGLLLAGPGLWAILPLQLSLIWLVRTLYFHGGVLSAIADAALQLFGLGAAIWAFSDTGSLAMAIWSHFLVQAFFPLLSASRSSRQAASPAADAFQQAQDLAETALRRLTSIH